MGFSSPELFFLQADYVQLDPSAQRDLNQQHKIGSGEVAFREGAGPMLDKSNWIQMTDKQAIANIPTDSLPQGHPNLVRPIPYQTYYYDTVLKYSYDVDVAGVSRSDCEQKQEDDIKMAVRYCLYDSVLKLDTDSQYCKLYFSDKSAQAQAEADNNPAKNNPNIFLATKPEKRAPGLLENNICQKRVLIQDHLQTDPKERKFYDSAEQVKIPPTFKLRSGSDKHSSGGWTNQYLEKVYPRNKPVKTYTIFTSTAQEKLFATIAQCAFQIGQKIPQGSRPAYTRRRDGDIEPVVPVGTLPEECRHTKWLEFFEGSSERADGTQQSIPTTNSEKGKIGERPPPLDKLSKKFVQMLVEALNAIPENFRDGESNRPSGKVKT